MATTTSMSSSSMLLDSLKVALGETLVEKILASRILVVGAGGIGTELLKNLALCGFPYLEVIDLDTIDTSNLNRQLLFRRPHVGMPKCTVACQVATDMAAAAGHTTVSHPQDVDKPHVGGVQYTAHHGNVCDNAKFHVQFVQGFDVVLNALDNVTARRRVNRLCLAAGVPLVEAGTTGYLGQVNVIDKESDVACYECKTQETQKVYPICTIRSTPSMPVHTIVWAKECYKLLFAQQPQESMLFEGADDDGDDNNNDDTNGDAGENNTSGEPSTFMAAVMAYRQARAAPDNNNSQEGTNEIIQKVLETLYVDEIQKQLDMGRYKTALKTPHVLDDQLIQEGCAHPEKYAPTLQSTYRPTDVWSPLTCVAEWTNILQTAAVTPNVLPEFDKDDALSMRFVTAASNLRSHVFSIDPLQSYYTAKGIAGNIIPAIATTNAIAAGLQILQLFRILQSQIENKSKTGHLAKYASYLSICRQSTRNGLLLTSSQLEPPNPHCYVCRQASMSLTLNTEQWTLQDLLERVIKKDMGFEEPSLSLGNDFIWEEGEDADTETFARNKTKRLVDLPAGGITHGTVLVIEDFSQDLDVSVTFTHQAVWESEDEAVVVTDEDYKFVLRGSTGSTTKSKDREATKTANGAQENDDDDDDEVVIVSNRKRPSAEDGDEPARKKPKASAGPEVDVIAIDD